MTPAHPNPRANLHHTATRLTKQYNKQTATAILTEYLKTQNPQLTHKQATQQAQQYTTHKSCACQKSETNTRVHKTSDGMIIYGPGSVSIVDQEGDKITGPALKQALPSLLRRKNLSLEHMDIQPGEILEKWEAPGGEVYRTEVREVTKEDLENHPRMAKAGVEPGDDALFVVAKVWGDTEFSREAQEQIEKGDLRCFSISGQATSETTEQACEGGVCKLVNKIDGLDLSAVTLCAEPMNQAAGDFQVLSKSQKQTLVERGWMQKANDGCPGGFRGLVETLASLADEDDKGEAVKKRAYKARATLDGHDPEDEAEAELYGILSAIVDAAEEGEHERVEKLYDGFMRAYKGKAENEPEEPGPDPEVEDDELKAVEGDVDADDDLEPEEVEVKADDDEPDYAEEGAADMVDAEEDLDEAMIEGGLEAAEDAAELVEHHAEDLQEVQKALVDLKKQLPPDADHVVVDPPTGTPNNPSMRPDHGRIHEDSPLAELDSAYNSSYPADTDRLEGAAGRTRAVSEGERETGETSQTEIEKALSALAKDCPAPEEHEPTEVFNEDFEEEDEEVMMKPAPEGVDEDKYDRCVDEVEDDPDVDNAHAVCAATLKTDTPPHNHKQDLRLHKQAMAQEGWNAIYRADCPTCNRITKQYDQPKPYFDAARHLRKTGALRLGWLSQADLQTFRKERAAGLFTDEIPTVGSA